MKIYYAVILDHKGQEVMTLPYTGSSKHSAFLANAFIETCPPASGFTIKKFIVTASSVATMLNWMRQK